MTRVHIISEGFASPNGRSFLYPIVMHKHKLAAQGMKISLSTERDVAIPECDTLLLDSKRFRDLWAKKSDEALSLFEQYRRSTNKLVFVDNTDSAGWINGSALSGSDVYWKALALRDRQIYLKPLYGRRVHSDYHHRRDGASDPSPDCEPQVKDQADLNKIVVHWNSGLADYSLLGPTLMGIYHKLKLGSLLRKPSGYIPSSSLRDIPVSCRMGVTYERQTVARHRELIRDKLSGHLRTEKLGRRAYYRELGRSRLVVSPFGLGAITLKDFETFIAGSCLLKPDMSHMYTWPDFYQPGETMLSHNWDLSDVDEIIARAADEPDRIIEIAERAQSLYKRYLNEADGTDEFCHRFQRLCGPGAPNQLDWRGSIRQECYSQK